MSCVRLKYLYTRSKCEVHDAWMQHPTGLPIYAHFACLPSMHGAFETIVYQSCVYELTQGWSTMLGKLGKRSMIYHQVLYIDEHQTPTKLSRCRTYLTRLTLSLLEFHFVKNPTTNMFTCIVPQCASYIHVYMCHCCILCHFPFIFIN